MSIDSPWPTSRMVTLSLSLGRTAVTEKTPIVRRMIPRRKMVRF